MLERAHREWRAQRWRDAAAERPQPRGDVGANASAGERGTGEVPDVARREEEEPRAGLAVVRLDELEELLRRRELAPTVSLFFALFFFVTGKDNI